MYINIDTFEMANKLYEMSEDIDYNDYEENKQQELNELEEALFWLKTTAENEHNKDYFRTLFNCLVTITKAE